MGDEESQSYEGFGTKAVHSGTNHIGDAVNTPIFQSSTYKLTDERYAGWAAGAQHTLLYARLSSVNSDAVAQKLTAMGALFAPFAAVASENPLAAQHDKAFTAADLTTVAPGNRYVASPYPQRLVARDQVNQSAALVVISTGFEVFQRLVLL